MHDVQPRPVKTGSDPRTLADFIALREEMSKLTHPARPDVNWKQVETLSLLLFALNGVELQTGAWYTLARSHLARVNGLNEGLAILNALLSHQWTVLWPQPVHARAEILNGLVQRLQKLFRTYSLGPEDLPALQLAEQQLAALDDILARQSLKHACQVTPLSQQIQAALTRLENDGGADTASAAITLPPQVLVASPAQEDAAPVSRMVYVIRPEPEVTVEVVHDTLPPPKRWPVFVAGACSALVVGALALWGWQFAHRVDEASQALTASVAPLPQTLTEAQIQRLRENGVGKLDATAELKSISSQLDSLSKLSPQWQFQYGKALLIQAQTLWPDRPEVAEMRKQWEQRLAANALPDSMLTDWQEGMQQLQQLTGQLNALDGKKGKYITVSELKSQVFSIMQSFNRSQPVEEQLRQLSMVPSDKPLPVAQQSQVEMALNALLSRYALIATRSKSDASAGEVRH